MYYQNPYTPIIPYGHGYGPFYGTVAAPNGTSRSPGPREDMYPISNQARPPIKNKSTERAIAGFVMLGVLMTTFIATICNLAKGKGAKAAKETAEKMVKSGEKTNKNILSYLNPVNWFKSTSAKKAPKIDAKA